MIFKEWFIFAILALIMWGLWGFFPKLSTNYINPKSALVYEVIGSVIVGMIIAFLVGFKPEVQIKGITFAVLTGIAATLGTLFFLYAVSMGKASIVVTTTALYPLITILLAFLILHEPITITQGIGILLALIAMVLFTL